MDSSLPNCTLENKDKLNSDITQPKDLEGSCSSETSQSENTNSDELYNNKVTKENSADNADHSSDIKASVKENNSNCDDINGDQATSEIPEEFQDSESDDDTLHVENDIVIDEDHLKDLEKELSEEEKIEKKEEAQKHKAEGNDYFKDNKFKEAMTAYSRGLQICPLSFEKERSVLYSNRAAARLKLGQKEEVVMDCSKALELNPNYLKALIRRAQVYRSIDKLDESLADYQQVNQLDKDNLEARQACMTLPSEIKERNEKLKEEMMGKLKDLGNMVLRPFGLSTENFKVVQDPNSGGYSINFQK